MSSPNRPRLSPFDPDCPLMTQRQKRKLHSRLQFKIMIFDCLVAYISSANLLW